MASAMTETQWRGRQAALLAALGGPKAVMVFGYGSALGAGTQSHGAMRYLTGWDSHEAMSLYIYSETQSLLLLSSPFMEDLAQAHFQDTQIIPAPATDWGAIIDQSLGANGPLATIGFSEMPQAIHQGIAACLPATRLVEADTPLAKQRMTKSAQEIAVLERGAALCDALFEALPAFLSSNRPASRTQLDLEHHARSAGADYCKTWLTVDRCATGPRYWPKEASQPPQQGDQVLFGIALTVEGYWAHGIRMGTIGQPAADHHRLWSVAHDALSRGQAALRNNAPLSDAITAMDQSVESGQQAFGWQAARHFRNGHGLGTSYEDPWATRPFTQNWHPGFSNNEQIPQITSPHSSVFELHPNLFVPSVGGVAIGDMFVVENTRARPLLQFPRSLMALQIS